MENSERLSLEQMQAFLEASEEVEIEATDKQERYDWVKGALVGQEYRSLGREAKGVVRRYVEKMTGLSRAQVTRLIGQYLDNGEVRLKSYRRHRFRSRYTAGDIELLAGVDEAHQTLSGPATQKLLQRALYEFGDERFERLAAISVAQLYRMRASRPYRQRRFVYQPTKPSPVSIGDRRRPDPQGRAGFIRIDTVHQGDEVEGGKGLYHINAVDEVTQWEVVAATPHISEHWLKPVLVAMLEQFPFRILGFHSDNGSEFVNHTVAKLLKKLLVEQTKSRPRHSNDNGLVEAKNGAIIRKHMGYRFIAPEHAEQVGLFYREHFNPYLNFHRPCGVPEIVVTAKGKQRRRYRWYATPWEILRQLSDVARQLKAGVTLQSLQQQASAKTDMQAAQQMQLAKNELFRTFHHRRIA